MENFKASSNYEQKCPFLKGNYTVTDLKITDFTIPVLRNVPFRYYQKLFGRVAGKKKLVHLYTSTSYGEAKKNEVKAVSKN